MGFSVVHVWRKSSPCDQTNELVLFLSQKKTFMAVNNLSCALAFLLIFIFSLTLSLKCSTIRGFYLVLLIHYCSCDNYCALLAMQTTCCTFCESCTELKAKGWHAETRIQIKNTIYNSVADQIKNNMPRKILSALKKTNLIH